MHIVEAIATTLRANNVSVRDLAKMVAVVGDKLDVTKDKRRHRLSGEKKVKFTRSISQKSEAVLWATVSGKPETYVTPEEASAALFADWHDGIVATYERHGMPEIFPAEGFPVGMVKNLQRFFSVPVTDVVKTEA